MGEEREKYFNAVSPPVIQSSNFAFKTVDELRASFSNEMQQPIYTRGNNPTVEILRKKIAALAGAEDALVFSSGVAAIAAAVMANVVQGDHVVCVANPYSWTDKLFNNYLPRFGVAATMVDGTDVNNFIAATKPETRVYFLESPNTFTFGLQDLEAIVKIAKERNIITIIDNSYCTSLGQRCIELGIDIEVHSASKYYGGHSDVIAGYLLSNSEMVKKIFATEFLNIGAIVSPNDASLLIRSLRTLPIRLEQIRKSTEQVVAFLATHPLVDKIIYPFEASFPQYELAQKQMKWCGGLFSIELKVDTVEEVETFCDALEQFLLAVSWGGHESLVMPACSFSSRVDFMHEHYPFNLIRFYIGLDDANFLIEDLKQAFKKIE